MEIINITDKISYLKATETPLSADVGIVLGNQYTWLFDIGSSDEAYRMIEGINSPKSIVISHFHADHFGNFPRVKFDELYVGKNTYGYSHCGHIVEGDLYIEDGCKIHLFPVPSCHAKGCVGMEVDETYVFLGDGAYPTHKGEQAVYNAQQLQQFITLLENLKAEYVLCSHRERFVLKKAVLLLKLKEIYSKRTKDNPFIAIDFHPGR